MALYISALTVNCAIILSSHFPKNLCSSAKNAARWNNYSAPFKMYFHRNFLCGRRTLFF